MRIEHECWMVWFRERLRDGGEWLPLDRTGRRTRRESIRRAVEYLGDTSPGRTEWRYWQRHGLMRCLRTTISEEVPDE